MQDAYSPTTCTHYNFNRSPEDYREGEYHEIIPYDSANFLVNWISQTEIIYQLAKSQALLGLNKIHALVILAIAMLMRVLIKTMTINIIHF